MAKRRLRKPGPTQHDIESEGLPTASGFDAEFRCPGKRALCSKLPKLEDIAAANRGQRIHRAIETWDLESLAETERRTAHRIMYGESEIIHAYNFEGADMEHEKRYFDFDDDLNKLWSGRVDIHGWMQSNRRLLIMDDKSGWTTVPPIRDNWQVKSEGALLANLYGAEETVIGLIHPHHPDSLWEAQVYTAEQTTDMLDLVRENVRRIQEPDAPRVAGGIQCQWCHAKRVCPEYKKAAADLARDIEDEIADEGFTAIIRRSKKERGDHVRWIKELIKNCEFILEQYVQMEMKTPESIAGWKIARRLTREITNELEAMTLTENRFGQDIMHAALRFSIPALEEELKKTMSAKDAKLAVRQCLHSVLRYNPTKYFLDEARSI